MDHEQKPVAVQERWPRRLLGWPQEVERYFDHRMRDLPGWPFRRFRRLLAIDEWLPDIDVFEREGKIVIRVDLPGLRPEDVDVTVAGDLLTVKGRRTEEKEINEEDYYCCERAAGEFSRTIRLPEGAGAEAIDARCDNGVLEVVVPRPAATEAKTVKVQVK